MKVTDQSAIVTLLKCLDECWMSDNELDTLEALLENDNSENEVVESIVIPYLFSLDLGSQKAITSALAKRKTYESLKLDHILTIPSDVLNMDEVLNKTYQKVKCSSNVVADE